MRHISVLVVLLFLPTLCCSCATAKPTSRISGLAPAGPVLVKWVEPQLSTPEQRRDLVGQVKIDALVGPDGLVREVKLNSSSGESQLDSAALLVAKQCTFEPAQEEGRSVPEWTVLYYVFPASEVGGTPCAQEDSNPKIRQWVRPAYPADAYSNQIEGTVIVKVLVSVGGGVEKAKVIQSVHPSLNEAALGAAQACLFAPATKDCVPTPAWMALPFNFRTKSED